MNSIISIIKYFKLYFKYIFKFYFKYNICLNFSFDFFCKNEKEVGLKFFLLIFF